MLSCAAEQRGNGSSPEHSAMQTVPHGFQGPELLPRAMPAGLLGLGLAPDRSCTVCFGSSWVRHLLPACMVLRRGRDKQVHRAILCSNHSSCHGKYMEIVHLSFSVLFTAMAGGNRDPGAGSDSPRPYMAFELFWELPAQGPNVSKASPAGMRIQPCLAVPGHSMIPSLCCWSVQAGNATECDGSSSWGPGVPGFSQLLSQTQHHEGHWSVLTNCTAREVIPGISVVEIFHSFP